MIKRGYKLIISVVLVVTLFIGFGSSFASAEPAIVTRVKAGVAAAMLAAQLVITPIDVLTSEPIASGIDPEGKLQWVETFPEYLERSKIRVYPDVVTIDGVPYTDIWLGPEAADSLRLKGLDFATAYNILNNQSSPIEYASGSGYFDGIPVYTVSGVRRTQSVSVTIPTISDINRYSFGNGFAVGRLARNTDSYGYMGYSSSTGSTKEIYGPGPGLSGSFYLVDQSNNGRFVVTDGTAVSSQFVSSLWNPEPFSFDYTSGVIDAPLAEEDGLLMRIPSSYTDPDPQVTTHNYDIHDLINIYPQVATPEGRTIEIDPDLNPDFQTDIDLGNGVGDLIRIILTLLDVLDNVDIEFAPEPDAPVPDPDPAVPDTPVGEQDGTWLDQLLRWIKTAIDTISKSVIDAKDAIINELQELSDTIQSIPDEILEDIETGPSKVFRKALDVLKSLFLPLLLPIKAMMGLWHYVVEWLTSVNAPFLWIFGIMSGTSANMVLPIYAVLAGSICIAIYKALGR